MFNEETRFIIVIISMLVFIFSFYWRKNKKAKDKKNAQPSSPALFKNASTEDLLDFRDKENDILLRISAVEREFSAKLDTKISMLNVLIEKADNKIAELQSLQVTSQPVNKVVESIDLPKQESLNLKVQQLKDAGLSAIEIANHLKMMVGEVNLILSILKKTKNE